MMQKLWQKNLKLNYNKDVIDIVQFGSSVFELNREEARDIDIAVIFNSISLKEQLKEAQKIKKQLEKYSEIPIHINSFDFYSFFDKSNFARQGIIFYGRSLLSKDYFAKRFGFIPKLQIFYFLDKLPKKDKVRLHYTLRGKSGKYGLLRKYKGELVSPGVIEVFPEFEKIFVDVISNVTKDFKIKRILKG